MDEQDQGTATAEATEEQPQADSENQQNDQQGATAPENVEVTAQSPEAETATEEAPVEGAPEEQPTAEEQLATEESTEAAPEEAPTEEAPAEQPAAEEAPKQEGTESATSEEPSQEGVREEPVIDEPQGTQVIQAKRAATKALQGGLTYDRVKEIFEGKEYAFFDEGDYNLNIGGIRCLTDTNDFDDLLFCAYKVGGNTRVLVWPATTDAGSYWLNNPMNQEGCAILVPGQYRGSHKVGIHRGQYSALTQAKSVKVYRDNDLDNEHDMDASTIENGVYGINIHRSNPYTESNIVDKWSAGCQVFKQVADFAELMRICTHAKAKYSNSFTYTLLDIEDFA